MKTNKITQAIGALAILGMSVPAVAADQTGWFIGGSGGRAHATIAEKEIIADLLAAGFETTDFSTDRKDFGYKLFAGYQFNPKFAIEAGYFDLGTFDYTATTDPSGSKFGTLSFSGWNLDFVGTMPLTERAALIGRFGVHEGKTNTNFVGTGAVNVLTPHYQSKDFDFKIGVGYQYQISDSWTFRLEAERFRMDDAVGNAGDIDLFSMGVIYRFGARKHAPVAAPAPAPAPTPAPAPPVAATEQYCSALEMQFEIGQDSVERVNREHIQVLATFMTTYPTTKAIIQGHTDNVGTIEDNQALSEQRAQRVVDFLIREHRIAASRLSAVGYGETRPTASNSTVEGQQANRRINAVIDCANDMAGLSTLPARTTLAMALEFDANSATVDAKYHHQLENVAKYLHANPDLIVTLEGHTDNANPAMAQAISEQRAQNVADYLVNHFRVDRSRLNVEGFGATRRDTYNITASHRQDNRRVNIILGYPK
ncbi:OmpA family protein [Aliidiomarina halalkaliphila]|uniref:OmpA family protein n=2 Tax=Aliidiomarina halalkaliphila TaxID=2593535 RepID=A0A552X1G2_9GAMM|nr:OmpA family protein [Aliidiomarina halalkaliphila]